MSNQKKRQARRRTVALNQDELNLLAGALGLYQQAMEKAAHLTYGFASAKARSQMIDHGIDAIDLRNKLFREWEVSQ